jgi:hypothetical protein
MEEVSKVEVNENINQPVKKKGHGCVTAFIIFLIILILFGVGIYFGFKKITSSLGTKDLRVKYTQQDYTNLLSNLNMTVDATKLCMDCPLPTFSKPEEINYLVSSEQASAAFDYINQYISFGKISGTQIKMENGSAELITNFTYKGKSIPIYMVGSIAKGSQTSISGKISTLKAGGITVPSQLLTFVEESLNSIANEKISAAGDTVRIDSIDISSKGVSFKGLLPTQVK